MSDIDNGFGHSGPSQVTPKRILMLFLGSLLLADPAVTLMIFDHVILALILPFGIVGVLLAADIFSGKKRRWVFAYAVNFVVLLSMGFHGEAVFRIIGEGYMVKDLYTDKGGYPFNKPFLNTILEDLEYRSQYLTNAQGFRMPKVTDPNKEINACDWLFIGDSFTQGAQVDYENLYTSILQNYFPDKVIVNAGVSGIGIPEQYEMARSLVAKLKPEAVFLQVSTFNDFMKVKQREMGLMEGLLHHSELARFLLFDLAFIRRERLPLGRWAEPFYQTHEENKLYNVFYIPSSPEKEQDLRSYRQYLGKLSRLCQKNGCNLIVFLVPSKEQANRIYLSKVMTEFKIDQSQLDMEKPNRLLTEWAKKFKADYLDMTPSFRASPVPLFFDIDEHPNIDGHALIASELAKKIGHGSGTESLTPLFIGARYPSFSGDGGLMSYQAIFNDKTVAVLKATGEIGQEFVSIGDQIAHPTLSPDGKWLALTQGDVSTSGTKVVLYERESGQKKYITNGINEFGAIPQFDHDGKRLAFAGWNYDEERLAFTIPQIVVLDLETNHRKVFGNGHVECWRPCFSPDGERVAYISNERGNFDLYVKNLRTEEVRRLTDSPYDEWDPHFNQYGSRIVYAARADGNWDLFELDLKSGKTVRLTATKGDEWDPTYSIDGKHIIYAGEFGFSGGVYMH